MLWILSDSRCKLIFVQFIGVYANVHILHWKYEKERMFTFFACRPYLHNSDFIFSKWRRWAILSTLNVIWYKPWKLQVVTEVNNHKCWHPPEYFDWCRLSPDGGHASLFRLLLGLYFHAYRPYVSPVSYISIPAYVGLLLIGWTVPVLLVPWFGMWSLRLTPFFHGNILAILDFVWLINTVDNPYWEHNIILMHNLNCVHVWCVM